MKLLHIFILIAISSVAYSQNLKCDDFKIGKIKIKATNYDIPISMIDRTDKIQKESSLNSKNQFEGKIEWKSDCSYELIYINPSPDMKDKKIFVNIESIKGNVAFCKSTFEGVPGVVLEFEMEKLK